MSSVFGHVVAFIGDAEPVEGRVRFEPVARVSHPSAIVVHSVTETPLMNGVARQALLPGTYRVTYRLRAATLPAHTITVTPEHTLESPLNLAAAECRRFCP